MYFKFRTPALTNILCFKVKSIVQLSDSSAIDSGDDKQQICQVMFIFLLYSLLKCYLAEICFIFEFYSTSEYHFFSFVNLVQKLH